MSSISFIPRSVKRRRTEAPPVQVQVSPNSVDSVRASAGPRPASEDHSPSRNANKVNRGVAAGVDISSSFDQSGESSRNRGDRSSTKAHKGPDLEELAFLVWLSLSDYALWSDADLRWQISSRSEGNDTAEEERPTALHDDGYIPLSYLRQHSSVFKMASSSANLVDQPETLYIKAIRAHASDLVDVRLILADAGSTLRANYWSKPSPATAGYEVRRKASATVLDGIGRSHWENLTLYVENIPNPYRTLPGVAKLVTSLLSFPSNVRLSKVQSVFFPPHHNDQPGSVPICKGFALVTLSEAEDVEIFLRAWPWNTGRKEVSKEKERQDPMEKEATKYGLRSLDKKRWEELKAEYLLYRQQLIEELNAENAAQQKISQPVLETRPRQEAATEPHHAATYSSTLESSATLAVDSNSPFPHGCLVFIRNVHPETNKTTLRALFSQAWKGDTSSPASDTDGVDYVDYSKGLDTCYLRLRSQAHAQQFLQYFTMHPTVQTSGLDGTGKVLLDISQERAKSEAMVPELVFGKREELYWEKIPEKVRRQAVEKALGGFDGNAGKDSNMPNQASASKKKNRRKDLVAVE